MKRSGSKGERRKGTLAPPERGRARGRDLCLFLARQKGKQKQPPAQGGKAAAEEERELKLVGGKRGKGDRHKPK